MTTTIILTITFLTLVMAWITNHIPIKADVDKTLQRLSKRNEKEIDKIKANFKPNARYNKA